MSTYTISKADVGNCLLLLGSSSLTLPQRLAKAQQRLALIRCYGNHKADGWDLLAAILDDAGGFAPMADENWDEDSNYKGPVLQLSKTQATDLLDALKAFKEDLGPQPAPATEVPARKKQETATGIESSDDEEEEQDEEARELVRKHKKAKQLANDLLEDGNADVKPQQKLSGETSKWTLPKKASNRASQVTFGEDGKLKADNAKRLTKAEWMAEIWTNADSNFVLEDGSVDKVQRNYFITYT